MAIHIPEEFYPAITDVILIFWGCCLVLFASAEAWSAYKARGLHLPTKVGYVDELFQLSVKWQIFFRVIFPAYYSYKFYLGGEDRLFATSLVFAYCIWLFIWWFFTWQARQRHSSVPDAS